MLITAIVLLILGFLFFTHNSGESTGSLGGIVLGLFCWVLALFLGAAGLAQRVLS